MSWRRVFRRRRWDAELQEEMNVHLAAEIEENVAGGYSPEEARRAALLRFGNPQQVREELCRQNTISWLDSLWRGLKRSARARPVAELRARLHSRYRSRHRRERRSAYRRAQRVAEAAALRQPAEAGAAL